MGKDVTLTHLHAVLDAIHKADRSTEGMTFEQFAGDTLTVDAMTQALRIAGGAMKPIPDSVRCHYPSVPWRDMIERSDWLISRYYEVTPALVWSKVRRDLLAIAPKISRVLEEETRREEAANG